MKLTWKSPVVYVVLLLCAAVCALGVVGMALAPQSSLSPAAQGAAPPAPISDNFVVEAKKVGGVTSVVRSPDGLLISAEIFPTDSILYIPQSVDVIADLAHHLRRETGVDLPKELVFTFIGPAIDRLGHSSQSPFIVRSPRPPAGDAAVSACAADLRRALAAGAPIQIDAPTPGCTLQAVAAGRALTATLSGPGRRPWITLGVAPRATVAPRLWDTLTSALAPYHSCERPSAPWAAAVLHIHDTPMWVGAWEQTLAWAWMTA